MSSQYPPYNNQPNGNQPQYPYNQPPPYNNQPNGNQPQYPYNQTPPYPYQQPPAQYPQQMPTIPPQYPYQQPGQFTQPPAPKLPLGQRFKALPKKTRAGLGCASLLFILSLCICSAVASNAGSSSQNASAVATAIPTHLPTATPKPTTISKPKPTPIPTPVPKPIVAPTPVPTQPPAPMPTQPSAPTAPPVHTGVNGNPWGYDFNTGNLIYNPPATICDYFNCIASFWKSTNGYVDECNDGTYSHSGGVSGACSHHGSEMRPLYSH